MWGFPLAAHQKHGHGYDSSHLHFYQNMDTGFDGSPLQCYQTMDTGYDRSPSQITETWTWVMIALPCNSPNMDGEWQFLLAVHQQVHTCYDSSLLAVHQNKDTCYDSSPFVRDIVGWHVWMSACVGYDSRILCQSVNHSQDHGWCRAKVGGLTPLPASSFFLSSSSCSFSFIASSTHPLPPCRLLILGILERTVFVVNPFVVVPPPLWSTGFQCSTAFCRARGRQSDTEVTSASRQESRRPLFVDQTWLQQYRRCLFLDSTHCLLSDPITFRSVLCWRRMIPGKILTGFAKFYCIVSVNDFGFPCRLQELLQVLLRFLWSFCFYMGMIVSTVLPGLVPLQRIDDCYGARTDWNDKTGQRPRARKHNVWQGCVTELNVQLSDPFDKSSCVYYLVLRFLSSCFCPSLSSKLCFLTPTFTHLPSSHLVISFSCSSSVFFVRLSFFFLLCRSSTRLPSRSNSTFPVSSSGTWPLWQLQLPPTAQLQWLSPHQPEHVQPQRLSSIASQSVCLSFQQPGWATLDILCSWPSCLLHGRHPSKQTPMASILSFVWKAFHAGPSSLALCVR